MTAPDDGWRRNWRQFRARAKRLVLPHSALAMATAAGIAEPAGPGPRRRTWHHDRRRRVASYAAYLAREGLAPGRRMEDRP